MLPALLDSPHSCTRQFTQCSCFCQQTMPCVPVCHPLLQPLWRDDAQQKRAVAAAVLHELLCLGDVAAHGHRSCLEPLELRNPLRTRPPFVFCALEGILHLGVAFLEECSKALGVFLQGLVAALEGLGTLLGVLLLLGARDPWWSGGSTRYTYELVDLRKAVFQCHLHQEDFPLAGNEIAEVFFAVAAGGFGGCVVVVGFHAGQTCVCINVLCCAWLSGRCRGCHRFI